MYGRPATTVRLPGYAVVEGPSVPAFFRQTFFQVLIRRGRPPLAHVERFGSLCVSAARPGAEPDGPIAFRTATIRRPITRAGRAAIASRLPDGRRSVRTKYGLETAHAAPGTVRRTRRAVRHGRGRARFRKRAITVAVTSSARGVWRARRETTPGRTV